MLLCRPSALPPTAELIKRGWLELRRAAVFDIACMREVSEVIDVSDRAVHRLPRRA